MTIFQRLLQVLSELGFGKTEGRVSARPRGVFPTVDQAVDAAYQAHLTLVAMPLEKRKEIIANIRKRCAADVHTLAQWPTRNRFSRVEDKILIYLSFIKTPGQRSFNQQRILAMMASP